MKICNLNKSFGQNVIFENLNLTIEENAITYVMGKSGIGKTTLLRIISGLDKEYTGEIKYSGKLSYVFQEPRLFPQLSVLENLEVVNESPSIDKIKLLEMLDLIGCENMMPHQLSGGMKMRLSIARALYYNPDVIIMDEPFASLDETTKEKITENIFLLLKNKTVIIVSHNLDDAQRYAKNIINL